MNESARRPCLALPFTVLTGPDTVRLISGEDFRYTLNGPGLDGWAAGWLEALDGRRTLRQALEVLPDSLREQARALAERLYGERVLVDGPAEVAHQPAEWFPVPVGSATWAGELAAPAEVRGHPLSVLCQDRLDYHEAIEFGRRCRREDTRWLWATTAPAARAYVSPLFLPDAGPCLGCLLGHFRRLSPAPELYDALIDHARAGHTIQPAPFPTAGLAVLVGLIRWKVELLAREPPSPAAYRLHVLEVDTLEVTAHTVFLDPECAECGGR